jgi:hypothetical protein
MADSSAGRLVGVLTAPGRTFRAIAERPTWGLALATLLTCSLLSTVAIFQKVDHEAFRQQMSAQMERRGQVPNEKVLDTMEKYGLTCGPAIGIGVSVVFYFAGAGILLVSSNLLGGAIDYRTSLAVILHAMMPLAVLGLLSIPVAFFGGAIDMQQIQQGGGLLPSSLAVVAPADAGPKLLALLNSFDLFTLWAIALLISGLHLAARISKGAAAAVVLSLWAILILLKVGAVALGGGA